MKWLENGESTHEFMCGSEKKNIFLIGDSIRRGYCATVKSELSQSANVFYVDDNCRSTQFVIFSLKGWAGKFNDPNLVDIVYFNCGHWDVAHWSGDDEPLTSELEYERNVRMIIRLLRRFFPNAELIFSTTCPMNPSGQVDVNPRSNEEIDRYNALAVGVCNENGVKVHDLNAFAKKFDSECYVDGAHFTKESFEKLGKEVSRWLKELI